MTPVKIQVEFEWDDGVCKTWYRLDIPLEDITKFEMQCELNESCNDVVSTMLIHLSRPVAVMKEFKNVNKQKVRICSFLDLTYHSQHPYLQLLNQWNIRQVIKIKG